MPYTLGARRLGGAKVVVTYGLLMQGIGRRFRLWQAMALSGRIRRYRVINL